MCEDAPCCGCCPPEFSTSPPEDDFDMGDEPMDDDNDDGQPSDLQENQDFAHDEDFGDRYDGCDEY